MFFTAPKPPIHTHDAILYRMGLTGYGLQHLPKEASLVPGTSMLRQSKTDENKIPGWDDRYKLALMADCV